VIAALVVAVPKETSNTDVIFGIVVVLALLPVFYVIGRVVSLFQNFKFAKHWAPLIPVLHDGTIVEDRLTAVTSRLQGTYQGVPVFATMTPNVQRYRYSRGNGNRFSVGVSEVPGASDWSARWDSGIPIIGTPGWSINAADTTLATRLESAGLIALIESFGQATLSYETRSQTLEWRANIEPWFVLPPERFRHVLDAMLDAALMSRALNH